MAPVELLATRMAAGGDALSREPSGRVVFVRGALPGERVRAVITEERVDYARASVVDVVAPSPARVDPPCPALARGCGGCTWQHIDPRAQRELKRAIVAEALTRTGGLADPIVADGPDLPPFGFRTTLRLGVLADGETGLRAWHRHDLIGLDACLIAHPLLDELLDVECPGATAVTLRCGARTGDRLALIHPLQAAGRSVLPPDVAVGRDAHLREEVAGRTFRVSARSFFQSRADGADALVAEVWAPPASSLRGSSWTPTPESVSWAPASARERRSSPSSPPGPPAPTLGPISRGSRPRSSASTWPAGEPAGPTSSSPTRPGKAWASPVSRPSPRRGLRGSCW